jgi:hypothetical protein
MFKAIDTRTQQPVIILNPQWRERINELRDASKQGDLVCQECQQPVQVRAGKERRWHFAHRHRQDCPIASEPAELLNAREALYTWLVSKFGADAVAIEERIPGLPRPVDCWVMHDPKPFAYWIVERTLEPAGRQVLLDTFSQHEVNVHWVLLAALLKQDPEVVGQVTLSTTERDLLVSTPYDAPAHALGGTSGKSLHYLDADNNSLTTLRGLCAWHPPAGYEGVERSTALADLLVSPRTGEFVHPGEAEERRAYEERLRIEAEEQRRVEERRQAWTLQQPTGPALPLWQREPEAAQPVSEEELRRGAEAIHRDYELIDALRRRLESEANARGEKENAPPIYRCKICGQLTTDYWTYNNQAQTCECRTCLREGRCG